MRYKPVHLCHFYATKLLYWCCSWHTTTLYVYFDSVKQEKIAFLSHKNVIGKKFTLLIEGDETLRVEGVLLTVLELCGSPLIPFILA